ncbi:MAG: tetratricopeptide repeat protein, partial [bacterium]|nr:tetratricopeptide repeat protein [bacterium]
FAGLFVSTTRFAAQGRQWGIIFSRSPRIGFVIVFSLTILLLLSVVAAYSLVGRYIATAELTAAQAAFSSGDLTAADRAVQNSISFAPSAAAYQIKSGIANTRLNQIAASTTMSAAEAQKSFQEALSTGINAALTATNLAPSDYQNWLALGNLYAQAVPLGVTSAYDSAKTAYDKARALNPTNPQIPYILAQLDIANKNTRAAEEDLKAAIALKQDYTAAIFLLSQLEVQDGNVKDALASALAAAYFQPNDPNILFQVGILYAASNDFANAAAALGAAVAANPQFANARYFLSAVYAKQGDMTNALAQMQAITDMSAENASAVTAQLAALAEGKNPFPANLLSVSPASVK